MRAFRSILPVAAVVLAIGAGASAYGTHHNLLDDGRPIGGAWTATGDFASLGALGPDSVRFTTGDAWRVRAEGDPRTLERLRFLVKDGRLLVGRRSGESDKLPAATVFVTAPAIKGATLAGSGNLTVDRLTGEAVSATVAGSGDLTVGQVAARSLNGRVAGSGDLTVSGRSADADLVVAGSGQFVGDRFTADTASTAIAGSGGVTLHSDGKVSARITGSGHVVVTGRATCTQSRIGSGSLRCGG